MAVRILSIKVDSFTSQDIEQVLDAAAAGNRRGVFIVTLNPEILLLAQEDSVYANYLNTATISLVDGFGLWLAVRLLYGQKLTRLPGADLIVSLLRLSKHHDLRVAILTKESSLASADEITQCLGLNFGLNPYIVQGTEQHSGGVSLSEAAFQEIQEYSPQVIFITWGAPWQEVWLAQNMGSLPDVRLAVGVGGALDFLVGKRHRAPRFLQKFGLEWLWRLLLEPRYRLRRVLRAVCVFPWRILRDFCSKPREGPENML